MAELGPLLKSLAWTLSGHLELAWRPFWRSTQIQIRENLLQPFPQL